MLDPFGRTVPIPTPPPVKVATKAEMDAAVTAAYRQGWMEALDTVAEAVPGVRMTLESLGWSRTP
jgi:hypothetical protein